MKELDYRAYLGLADINKGDVIDVCSDMLSIVVYCKMNGLDFSADHLIDALQEAVGTEGTVMIRSFSWDFCKGIAWDILHSPSRTGSLGNCALKRQDFVRTRHPMYSWLVWGKYAAHLQSYENADAFDKSSIFQFLQDCHGRQLHLGNMSQTAMTMIHHAEEALDVPYRKQKFFEADYIDLERNISKRRYSMYVRPLNVDVSLAPFEDPSTQSVLVKKGIRNKAVYGGVLNIETTELSGIVNFVVGDILENDGRSVVMIGGKNGIASSGVDFSAARYY